MCFHCIRIQSQRPRRSKLPVHFYETGRGGTCVRMERGGDVPKVLLSLNCLKLFFIAPSVKTHISRVWDFKPPKFLLFQKTRTGTLKSSIRAEKETLVPFLAELLQLRRAASRSRVVIAVIINGTLLPTRRQTRP